MSGAAGTTPKKKKKKSKKVQQATLRKKEDQKQTDDLLVALSAATQDGSLSSSSSTSTPSVVSKGGREERWGRWAQADLTPIRIRGLSYFDDRKKIPASTCHFELVHVDIWACPTRLNHVAARPDSYCQKRSKDLLNRLVFVVNWLVPGTPECNWVTYFQNTHKDDGFDLDIKEKTQKELEEEDFEPQSEDDALSVDEEEDPPTTVKKPKSKEEKEKEKEVDHRAVFARSLNRFLKGSDNFRHRRFKFVPRIVEGNWVVQRAVGATPAILGSKMTQSYHFNKALNYFEVDVDVGSSSVAKSILNLVRGYAKAITIDCLFLIEGQRADELPEQLLGGVRLSGVDYTKFVEAKEFKTSTTTSSSASNSTSKRKDSS